MFKVSRIGRRVGLGRKSTGGRPLRIAYGRINQETNAFSPESSEFKDFVIATPNK